jgi:hypothetical protein
MGWACAEASGEAAPCRMTGLYKELLPQRALRPARGAARVKRETSSARHLSHLLGLVRYLAHDQPPTSLGTP